MERLVDVLGSLFGSLRKLAASHREEVVFLLLPGEGDADLGPLRLIQAQLLFDQGGVEVLVEFRGSVHWAVGDGGFLGGNSGGRFSDRGGPLRS